MYKDYTYKSSTTVMACIHMRILLVEFMGAILYDIVDYDLSFSVQGDRMHYE
jgi:hypothetical protein